MGLEVPPSVTMIDGNYTRPQRAAAYLVVDNGEAAFFDTATRFAVPDMLRSLRPEVPLKLNLHIEDNLMLRSDQTLLQALINFLNNAADVSPHWVELRAVQDRLNPLKLVIEVRDRGPGITPELRQRLGKGLVTSKADGRGHGTGVLIAQAAIERFGGSVAISVRRSGGTCVRVELPGFRLRKGKEDESRRERIAGR